MTNEEIFNALDRLDNVLARLPRSSGAQADDAKREAELDAWNREHKEAWSEFRRVAGD